MKKNKNIMRLLNITLYLFTFFVYSKADLNVYTIVQNDTCFGLIDRYNICNKSFYEINPGINCNLLIPGNTVNLFNNDTLIISKKDLNDYVKNSCKNQSNSNKITTNLKDMCLI